MFRTVLMVAIAAAGAACSVAPSQKITSANAEISDKKRKHDRDREEDAASTARSAPSAPPEQGAGDCDAKLWEHVYRPERLEIRDQCKTVTGVIRERDSNSDGDEHMLLKLDPGQDDLLTKRNEKKKEGALVIEAVCAHPPDEKKAKDACRDFSNSVYLPQVGEHVRVTGSYVIDSHNGWSEIHPISRIEKIE